MCPADLTPERHDPLIRAESVTADYLIVFASQESRGDFAATVQPGAKGPKAPGGTNRDLHSCSGQALEHAVGVGLDLDRAQAAPDVLGRLQAVAGDEQDDTIRRAEGA